MDVFINGTPVLTANDWQVGHKADVTAKLVAGENVIALRTQNADASPAGAIARLEITSAKGKQTIVTDTTWKGADKETKDWSKPGFDDAKWAAVQSIGKIGIEPWGNVFGATVAAAAGVKDRKSVV